MLKFGKKLIKRYGTDDIAGKAAALAYYTIFSLGPLLFLIFGILGELLKNDSYRARIIEQTQSVVGPQAGSLIEEALNHQTLSNKTGVAFFIGIVGLVLGAIGIFGQLQKSLNGIFRVKVGPDAGRRPLIMQKVISLGLVGVICFLLLVSLIASASISVASRQIINGVETGALFHVVDFGLSILVISVLLTLLYRTLPNIKLPWKPLFVASLVVASLFSLGKAILALIIGNNSTITAYGAASSLIALLLWIFYSAQIVYLGAAGLGIYAEGHPNEITPRYKGERGVLRLRYLEEPLLVSLNIPKKVGRKFKTGFKKGLKKKS